jgi:hypothetical protein
LLVRVNKAGRTIGVGVASFIKREGACLMAAEDHTRQQRSGKDRTNSHLSRSKRVLSWMPQMLDATKHLTCGDQVTVSTIFKVTVSSLPLGALPPMAPPPNAVDMHVRGLCAGTVCTTDLRS